MRGPRPWVGRLILVWLALAAAPCLHAQISASPIAVPNSGFERGAPGEAPPDWHGTVAAAASPDPPASPFRARVDPVDPREGRFSVRLESAGESVGRGDFGTVTASIDAERWRGRRIRLTGAVRTEVADGVPVGLWLRVDRARSIMGSFDNRGDRPIHDPAWHDYVIEGDVAADAEHIVFGLLLAGPGKAWLDDVRLEDVGPAHGPGIGGFGPARPRDGPVAGDVPPRPLTARALANLHAFARVFGLVRFFHPSDEAAHADWNALAMIGVEQVEGARTPAELAAALNRVFRPVAPGFEAVAGATSPIQAIVAPSAEPRSTVRWEHVGMGGGQVYHSERVTVAGIAPDDVLTEVLPGGVAIRLPMVVWRDGGGATLPRATATLPASAKPPGYIPAGFDRTTRLAATVTRSL